MNQFLAYSFVGLALTMLVIDIVFCQIQHLTKCSLIYTKDMRHALGFRYQTPMGYILEGFGTSLSWLGLGAHSFQEWKMDSAKAYACLVQ